jgi:hypothetical protein
MTVFLFSVILFSQSKLSVVKAADYLKNPVATVKTDTIIYQCYNSGRVTPLKKKETDKYAASDKRPIIVVTGINNTSSITIDIETFFAENFKNTSCDTTKKPVAIIFKNVKNVNLSGTSDLNASDYLAYIRITDATNINDSIKWNGSSNSILEEFATTGTMEQTICITNEFGGKTSKDFNSKVYRNLTIGTNDWRENSTLILNNLTNNEFYDITLNGLTTLRINHDTYKKSNYVSGRTSITQSLSPSNGYTAVVSPAADIATADLQAGVYVNNQIVNTITSEDSSSNTKEDNGNNSSQQKNDSVESSSSEDKDKTVGSDEREESDDQKDDNNANNTDAQDVAASNDNKSENNELNNSESKTCTSDNGVSNMITNDNTTSDKDTTNKNVSNDSNSDVNTTSDSEGMLGKTVQTDTEKQTESTTVKKVTIQKTTNKTTGKIKIYLKKIKGYKYQIVISTNKKFKKGVKKYTTSKTSYTIKNLKNGKRYYVRARVFKKVNGKKVYGKWTAIKSIRTNI